MLGEKEKNILTAYATIICQDVSGTKVRPGNF